MQLSFFSALISLSARGAASIWRQNICSSYLRHSKRLSKLIAVPSIY